ncbi:MAG: hypothetical protein KGM99_16025, partial [Burkholderiales bacterium]|nr:hypothetical protein [Burkholderiales bacterium]
LQQHFKGQAPVFSSNSAYAQLRAARMGLGTILLPRFIGQADPDLQEVPLTRAPVCREIWLVYHRDLKASARVQIMREFITEEVRQHLSNFPVA